MVPSPFIALVGAYNTSMMSGIATGAVVSAISTETLAIRSLEAKITVVDNITVVRNNYTKEQRLPYDYDDDDDHTNTYQYPDQTEPVKTYDEVEWSGDGWSGLEDLMLLRAGTPVVPPGTDVDHETEFLSQQQRATERATIELLEAVMEKLAKLSINNEAKEKRSLPDEISQRHQESIDTISAYPSAVNTSRKFTTSVDWTSSEHDNDDFELAEYEPKPRMRRQSDIRHPLRLSPEFPNATDVYQSKLNETNLEKISALLEEAMELQRGGLSGGLVRRDFSKAGSLFSKGVLKVLEYAIRGLRADKTKLSCTQISEALDKVFLHASAIESGIDFYPEQFHSMSKRFRTKHPLLYKLYQITIKECIEKKKQLMARMESDELESDDNSVITEGTNSIDHRIQNDTAVAYPLKDDHHHDKRDLSTVGSQIVFFNGSVYKASILPRDTADSNLEHSTMHLHVSLETLTMGLLIFLACLSCIWVRQFWVKRRSKRQQLIMSKYECPQDVKAAYCDQESGFVDDFE